MVPCLASSESDLSQPVELGRGAGEECGFVCCAAAGGDAFGGVPQRRIAAAALIDRELALDHRGPPDQVRGSAAIRPGDG